LNRQRLQLLLRAARGHGFTNVVQAVFSFHAC